MKQYGDYLLPSVGKYFKSNNVIQFKVPADAEYEELDINPDNITIAGQMAFVDSVFAVGGQDYRELKTNLVKKLFSNDDQIAIMLNEDEDMLSFMNDWRAWFGNCAKKIISLR